MTHLYIGGVNYHAPWWGVIVPSIVPPTAPSPDQLTRITVIPATAIALDPGLAPGQGTTTSDSSPGFLSHVDPVLGAVGFIVGVGLKLYPPTRVAGFLIGVGIVVLNWGSEPAGGDQVGTPRPY